MKLILDWLQHNKEWVFSGAGVTLTLGIIQLMCALVKLKSRALLQVSLGFGGLTYEVPPYLSEQMLLFSVANRSDKPAQLTSIHLPLKGCTMIFNRLCGEQRIPCMIAPGTNVKFWIELADVEASLKGQSHSGSTKIHAVASDALGNEYRSNSVSLARKPLPR